MASRVREAAPAGPSYRVIVGIDYPTKDGDRRAESGDIVTDLPARSVEWLLAQGIIVRDGDPDPETPPPGLPPVEVVHDPGAVTVLTVSSMTHDPGPSTEEV